MSEDTHTTLRTATAAPEAGTAPGLDPDHGSPRATTNSLFEEPWWLDAVAPGEWDAVTISRGGRVVARLPYVLRRRYRLPALLQAPFTQSLGPWVDPGDGSDAHRLGVELELVGELLDALPPVHAHYQQFAPALSHALPFLSRGYRVTPRYTYRIEDISDLERVWNDFRRSVRRQVRKAEQQFEVRDDLGLDVLLELHRETIGRMGAGAAIDEVTLRRIDAALAERGGRRLLVAVDAHGKAQAADYQVWDRRCVYSILARQRDDARGAGAPSLLLWDTMQHAAGVAPAFDFQGSMIPSIERFNRGFGGRPVQYLSVEKVRRWMEPLVAVRNSLRRGGARLWAILAAATQYTETLAVVPL